MTNTEPDVSKRLDTEAWDASLSQIYAHYGACLGIQVMDEASEAAISMIVDAGLDAAAKDDLNQPIGGHVQTLLTLAAARSEKLANFMYRTSLKQEVDGPQPHLPADYVRQHVLAIYRGIMSGQPELALDAIEVIMTQQGWTARMALEER